MTPEELNTYLESHENVEWQIVDDAMLFRIPILPWYAENENNATSVKLSVLLSDTFTPHDLDTAIRKGVDVEHITRVTGYFAKTRSFNPGKLGELKDRRRTEGLRWQRE